MTLPPPLAVGFAVAGGTPINAGAWATVDLDAFLDQRSRGIVVATEPVEADGQSLELARLAREMIVAELRAMDDLPPDEAIGRAFAAVNGMLFDEGQTSPTRGYDRKVLIGATAVLLDGHRCTIGHVPPGQIVLIEDGLAYAVPDLSSWMPDYVVADGDTTPPEPLGYTSWTAPILAQTELSDGDVVMICTASLAEALAIDLDETDMRVQDLAGYHGRSPDRLLDIYKGLLIADRIEDGAAVVIGFPPRPGSFGVVTLDDVRWRLRERRRRTRAQIRSLLPRRVRSMGRTQPQPLPIDIDDADDIAVGRDGERAGDESEPSRWLRARSRLRRHNPAETWSSPTQAKQYGLPRTHGVQLHRSVSVDRGESDWRRLLPRTPVAAPLMILIVLAMIAALFYGIWTLRPDTGSETDAAVTALQQVDQNILAAENSTSREDREQALDLAQSALDTASDEGAQQDEIAPRQAAITAARDRIDNVIRVSNLTRIGTLPTELHGGGTDAQLSGAGLFLVNGGLYQIRTDERQVIPILEQGEKIGDVEVGDLYGVALDAIGLHVTDGTHAFTLEPDGNWKPVALKDINGLGRWEPGPVGAFGGSIYILETEFRNIYRFDTESGSSAEPNDWVLPSVRPDLVNGVDMAIDRNIYVLLDNEESPDEVLTYSQGDLKERVQVPYVGESKPASLLIGPATRYLYVAVTDGNDGAIVVFDGSSGDAWQLKIPADFSASDADVAAPFEGLQDIAVDEDAGTLYLVNEDAVWTAQYQLPVDATGTPTPQAETPEG
jgi:hypothetical protein